MAFNKNGNYSQQQIVDMLYEYMVEGQSAGYVCKHVLHMPESKIGNSRSAWRNLQPYYQSYGFLKRYNGAFRNISKYKLSGYVSKYWDKRATEQDLINYFPEILNDLNAAKKAEGDREISQSSWGSSTGSSSSKPNFDRRKNATPTFHQGNATTSASSGNQTANGYRSTGTGYASHRSTAAPNYNRTNYDSSYSQNTSYGGSDGDASGGAGVLAIVVLIILAIVIIKTGCFGLFKALGFFGHTVGHAFGGVLGKLFWILELLLFYGGIILLVISLFKKTTRYVWLSCVGLSLMGLGFGYLSDGSILVGIIMLIIGGILVGIKTRR